MLIVSASNVSTTRERSKSLTVATALKNGLESLGLAGVRVIDLRDYDFGFCVMCQGCAAGDGCVRDPAFNAFHGLWKANDDVILVVPHYASIPSKLLCAFEKLQETHYLAYCQGKGGAPAKRVMIIAHGGLTENYRDTYVNNLIKPLGGIVQSVGGTVVNDLIDGPLCFGVKRYLDSKEASGECFAKEDDDTEEKRVIESALSYYGKGKA